MRGEVGKDNGGKGKRFSETTIKDKWTKPRGRGGSKGGRWIWLGAGMVEGKCRQL